MNKSINSINRRWRDKLYLHPSATLRPFDSVAILRADLYMWNANIYVDKCRHIFWFCCSIYKLSQFSSCHYCLSKVSSCHDWYICHHSNQHLDYLDQHDDCHQVCNKHRGGDDGVHEVLFGSKRRLDGYSSLIRRQSNTLLSTHTCKTWLQKLKQFKLKQLTKMFLFWGTGGGLSDLFK